MTWYAGVDLGATNVSALVAGEDGTIVGRDRRMTPTGPSGDAVSEAVTKSVVAAAEAAGIAPADIVACGVGSAGPLDPDAGVVNSPNFGERIDRVPVVDPLQDRLDADVRLFNDAVAGVIGERFYATEPVQNMVYLTISSGIGAGAIVDGTVLSGVDGNAAEVGHWVVEPGGLTCGCGLDGHWEAYCAGSNLPSHARHLHEEGVETDLPLDSPAFSAADVFAAATADLAATGDHPAAAGDDLAAADDEPLANQVIDACARYNARGVANLVHAYAPELIAIGGAVACNNPEQVIAPLQERVPTLVMTNVPEIRLTALGEETVVRGALAAVLPPDDSDCSEPES